MFAGPLLGGAAMSAFSPSVVLAVNAATFFIAAVTILRSSAVSARPAAADRWLLRSWLRAGTGSAAGRVSAGITGLPRRWEC